MTKLLTFLGKIVYHYKLSNLSNLINFNNYKISISFYLQSDLPFVVFITFTQI